MSIQRSGSLLDDLRRVIPYKRYKKNYDTGQKGSFSKASFEVTSEKGAVPVDSFPDGLGE